MRGIVEQLQEELFFLSAAEAVEIEGVFLDAGVNLQGDPGRGLGQGVKGGQGDEHQVAHAAHLHQDLGGALVQELAFQEADHEEPPGQRW